MGRQYNRKVEGMDLNGAQFSNPRGLSGKTSRGWPKEKGIKERWKLFKEIIVTALCASCFTVEKRQVA